MFVLSIIKVRKLVTRLVVEHNPTRSLGQDTIAVKPHQFGIPADQALISEINTIYANKVLHDVGLCIAVFDLVEVGEGKVRYGDGCLWYKRASCPLLPLSHSGVLVGLTRSFF